MAGCLHMLLTSFDEKKKLFMVDKCFLIIYTYIITMYVCTKIFILLCDVQIFYTHSKPIKHEICVVFVQNNIFVIV